MRSAASSGLRWAVSSRRVLKRWAPNSFAVGVCGFEDAVGVEDEAIAGFERAHGGGVGGEGEGGEHEAVLFKLDDLAGAEQEQGWMTGGGVSQGGGGGVEIDVGCGDETGFGCCRRGRRSFRRGARLGRLHWRAGRWRRV